jgi:cell wall-associated NlpC family hydrolase
MTNLLIRYSLMAILPVLLVACADEDHFDPHLKNKQDPLAYLDAKTAKTSVMWANQAAKTYQAFLKHYYSPWTDKASTFTDKPFKNFVKGSVRNFSYHLGYDENQHHHSRKWMNKIVENIRLASFPNRLQNAIVVRSAIERSMPTNKPSFASRSKPGHTFPFDDFQDAFLAENLPVKILQESKDRAWDLVQTNGSMGWVKASALATVNSEFIKKWQENKGYIEVNRDHVSVIDHKNVYRFMARMGAIYPIQSETSSDYIINIAIKNPDGKAMITTVKIAKKNADKIPLMATPENVAKIAKRFIGKPYGWGELYGYRDCSATLKDIFSYFGIWLPRDASQQADLGGKEFHVKDFKNSEKLKMLEEKGIPFFTLVHLDGHIMLYLGQKDGKTYVLHDMWGLKTRRLFRSNGRAVVGKTVITPIDFGHKYINVKASLLDRMIDFTNLSS